MRMDRHAGLILSALVAFAAGCSGSSDKAPVCAPGQKVASNACEWKFSGATAATWETLATNDNYYGCPGFSDYTPAGSRAFYDLEGTYMWRWDPSDVWTDAVAQPPTDMGCWPSPAWVGNKLYVIQANAVYAYSTASDDWVAPITSGLPPTDMSMNAHDDTGHVFAMVSDGSNHNQIIRYDTSSGAVDYFAGDDSWASGGEARLAWDSKTRKLYIGPGYQDPTLWALDPTIATTAGLARKADVPAVDPAPPAMGDVFCSDRSGHLYAQGGDGCDGSASMFQYDTATDTWTRLPDLPFNNGCNGACTVTDDGYLYVTDNGYQLARLKLQ